MLFVLCVVVYHFCLNAILSNTGVTDVISQIKKTSIIIEVGFSVKAKRCNSITPLTE